MPRQHRDNAQHPLRDPLPQIASLPVTTNLPLDGTYRLWISSGSLRDGEEHWRLSGAEVISLAMFSKSSQSRLQAAIEARAYPDFAVDLVKAHYAGRAMPSVRRLTAILAADVAGYSRLMGADEEGTHERLKAHLQELVDPKIDEHRGRIVKNTGDGLLAEFASVVDAVRCAVEVQRGMAERNATAPVDQRIEFRIGINLGDVIAEEHDIFGDGVNVAARLEGLAEPGGICISRMVRDQIRDKLPYSFEDRGEHSVKNIARPVRVYALRAQRMSELPMASVPIAGPRRRRGVVAPIAAAIVAVLVIAIMAWWVWPATKPSTSPAVAAASSVAQPFLAPRLSIVVLPFTNLSNDPDQQYFADGITEDLTTDLSRIGGMFVISRDSAFTYKGRPVNAKQIARELGVRYLLEGSVQRYGNQVRINAQLIAAHTDAHLWAERFDRELSDLFALQNEITGRIAVALNAEMIGAEAARPTERPGVTDYIFRGRAAFLKPLSRETYDEAVGYFERALALHPASVEARSGLAGALTGRVLEDMTNSPAADLERAEALARQVVAASPRSPLAHFARGQVLRAQGQYKEAIPEYEAVIAFNRNAVGAISALADCKLHAGPIEEVVPLQEQALRLSPRDPFISNMYGRIGVADLLQSRADEAIVWLEKARDANPARLPPHSMLAAAYGLKGETERAVAELAEARKLVSDDRFSSIARQRVRIAKNFENPAIRALFETTFFAGLRKAGVPEE
jgi:adenylate cyclase